MGGLLLTFELKRTVSRSRMSTKISFFLPVDAVELMEMGFWTAVEDIVFFDVAMPPRKLSTAMGSLWTYIFSISVLVLWG